MPRHERAGAGARLLVTGLAQVATPAGDGALRCAGDALGSVDVIEDAFVRLRRRHGRGGRADARPAGARTATSRSSTARGLCAIPGLVDCHTHVAFGGDRVDEFSLRAAGAGYEELHAAGGGILSTVRATRALGEAALRERVARHAGWMLRHGTTTWEGKSGYGLDRETELASLRAVAAAGGRPTWLGAHAVPPERPDADAYLDFALAEVLPEAARLAEAADVFLERGAFDAAQARRYLPACRAAGLELRLHGDQFTESGAIPLAIELGARSVDHLEATGPAGVRGARRERGRRACCCRRARSSSTGRCRRARALVDAGAAVALATDFNPGSSFTTSLPLVCSLAATQLKLAPAEALCGGHGERRARPRLRARPRAHRARASRRPRAARRARLALPRLPPGGRHRRRRRDRRRRESPYRRIDHLLRCRPVSSAAAARRGSVTSTSSSLLDEEGNEIPLDPDELRAEREAKDRERAQAKPANGTKQQQQAGARRPEPPGPRGADADLAARRQARRADGRADVRALRLRPAQRLAAQPDRDRV